jgi:hypothetical protein
VEVLPQFCRVKTSFFQIFRIAGLSVDSESLAIDMRSIVGLKVVKRLARLLKIRTT